MLTTSQIIQNAASSLWPVLLILISWYAIAVALRALGEFFFRWVQRYRIRSKMERLEKPNAGIFSAPGSDTVINESSESLRMNLYLDQLQQNLEDTMLRTHRADNFKLGLLFFEGLLFTLLALGSLYAARELVGKMQPFWWLHLLGPLLFLCFLLRARRILLFIPLVLLAWVSWEIFAFIGGFEKTLEATSELAQIEVLEKIADPKGPKLRIRLRFPNGHKQEFSLFAREKLYLEGRVFRVSADVLLFGGKNLASIERVFSDDIAPNRAVSLLDAEDIPPRYRWTNYEKSFRNQLRKRLAYFLWSEFFSLRKRSNARKLVNVQLLEAAICSPMQVGKKYSLRLRHVGGLECHPASQATSVPVTP
ncbi:MAG: hypothetical protein H6727_10470 [Myxococcales bacterium]|nr:hypothetical protein [Myxococcales bacterium]